MIDSPLFKRCLRCRDFRRATVLVSQPPHGKGETLCGMHAGEVIRSTAKTVRIAPIASAREHLACRP